MVTKIIKPHKLKHGDNIGIIALSTPASKLKREFRERGYKKLKDLFGFNLIEAPNIDQVDGHSAGTVKDRVKSLHQFFKRKDIHGIISFWGGNNSHQILEYLDYDLIRKNPKVLVGYSDTTSILSAITHKTGLITFNGPAVITFAKPTIPNETIDCFQSLLFDGRDSYEYPVSRSFSDNQWWQDDSMQFSVNGGLQVFRKGKAEGRIVGGNIGTLLLLAGTPYFPSMKGKILFVEEDELENPASLDRFFTQLRHMGVYDQISGMVIGRFARSIGLTPTDSLNMILENALRGYKFPVITEFDMGHTDPIMTVPLGAKIRIGTKSKEIQLMENVVEVKK